MVKPVGPVNFVRKLSLFDLVDRTGGAVQAKHLWLYVCINKDIKPFMAFKWLYKTMKLTPCAFVRCGANNDSSKF